MDLRTKGQFILLRQIYAVAYTMIWFESRSCSLSLAAGVRECTVGPALWVDEALSPHDS